MNQWETLLPFPYLSVIMSAATFSPIATCGGCAVLCLVAQSRPALCDTMDCSPAGSSVHGGFPGKNTAVGCRAVLQQIFPTLGLNRGPLHCRQILDHQRHEENPYVVGICFYHSASM